MHQIVTHHRRLLLALAWLLCPAAALAQDPPLSGSVPAPDWANQRSWASAFDAAPDAARARANRIQLFRIVPGFLADPVGLESDDPADAAPASDGPDWLQVSLGNDNPFFDFRLPGDPGGVGYYKVHTQLQLFGTRSTSFALSLQAVTPAGLDQDGVADGPTVVSPSLCVYHELGDGTALQGFIGRHLPVNASLASGPIHRNVQYGVAVQRPLLDTGPDNVGSFYLFVEALGRYRYDATDTGPPAVWEMVPGVHWRMTDNLWLSGGVLMPVNAAPTSREARLWQFTFSFQF
jgi:hypothetical protein